jgi:hypothetical protein
LGTAHDHPAPIRDRFPGAARAGGAVSEGETVNAPQNPVDEAEARRRLAEFQLDHSDLEVAILAIGQSPVPDMLVIGRLKRKKLALKDQIQRLKDQLTPDIIA